MNSNSTEYIIDFLDKEIEKIDVRISTATRTNIITELYSERNRILKKIEILKNNI